VFDGGLVCGWWRMGVLVVDGVWVCGWRRIGVWFMEDWCVVHGRLVCG
jgi:hypothetical protein